MIRNSKSAITPRGSGSIVVPAVDAPSSVAVCRSLGRRGVRTVVATTNGEAAVTRSRYCDETRFVPDPSVDFEGYLDGLLALAAREDVRTIIPVREEDVYTLATRREAFGEHIATPWPDFERLARAQDRIELAAAAEEAGISMPATELATDWDRWDRDTILKARYSLLANRYLDSYPTTRLGDVPKTEFFEGGEKPDLGPVIDRMGHVPIAQEYVDNRDEYGFFALYDHGEAVATFQHRQIRAYHYSGGASAFRESVSIPALETAGRALLDQLEWHGLAMVEFLRNESGGFELMEVNPRCWSSLPFSVQAGADFPFYYWLLATEQDGRIDPTYDVGMAGHLLRGELIHLYSVLTQEYPIVSRPTVSDTLRELAGSIARHPRFDYLVPSDPLPFVYDFKNAVGSLWGGADDDRPAAHEEVLTSESKQEAKKNDRQLVINEG
jgi:predicted ATP-grasp superfamily ATP-dependent carboligase